MKVFFPEKQNSLVVNQLQDPSYASQVQKLNTKRLLGDKIAGVLATSPTDSVFKPLNLGEETKLIVGLTYL